MKSGRLATKQTHSRRGATLVEAAIVTIVLVMLLLGTIDLGIAVLRYNMLAEAARTGARMAIVHGSDAPSEMPTWDSSLAATEITAALEPLLAASGIDTNDFSVTVTYEQVSGSDNAKPGSPVTVQIDHDWVPIMSFIFGGQAVSLTAMSKMIIAN